MARLQVSNSSTGLLQNPHSRLTIFCPACVAIFSSNLAASRKHSPSFSARPRSRKMRGNGSCCWSARKNASRRWERLYEDRTSSHAFEDEGDALADADTHGAKGVASVCAKELVERGADQARAAGAKGMADGDSATVRIHVCGIVGNA